MTREVSEEWRTSSYHDASAPSAGRARPCHHPDRVVHRRRGLASGHAAPSSGGSEGGAPLLRAVRDVSWCRRAWLMARLAFPRATGQSRRRGAHTSSVRPVSIRSDQARGCPHWTAGDAGFRGIAQRGGDSRAGPISPRPGTQGARSMMIGGPFRRPPITLTVYSRGALGCPGRPEHRGAWGGALSGPPITLGGHFGAPHV